MILGVADISEAAWRKRIRQCGDWLQWLLIEVISTPRRFPPLTQQRVILVDGTSLGQTGGTGDDWRVQLAYDLVEGRLVDVLIGDRKFAETLIGLEGEAGRSVRGRSWLRKTGQCHCPGWDAGGGIAALLAQSLPTRADRWQPL